MNCDHTILRRSLDESLSEAEEELLSAHLCECDVCQRELEKLAGQPAAWNRVGTILKTANESSEFQIPVVKIDRSGDHEAASDLAVECLDPSSSREFIGRLGDIDIQDVIGYGGMGVVLKGYQSELKRLVAVKVLAPQLAVSAAARKRFAREAQATAAIIHKLLAKHPEDQFASAVEVAQLLEGCLAHVQQPGTVSLPAECAAWITPRPFRM